MLLTKNNVKIWTILTVFAAMLFILNLMTLFKLPSCDINISNNKLEIISKPKDYWRNIFVCSKIKKFQDKG